ncbi:unnamed protein product, partial [Ilex paraguariensis]
KARPVRNFLSFFSTEPTTYVQELFNLESPIRTISIEPPSEVPTEATSGDVIPTSPNILPELTTVIEAPPSPPIEPIQDSVVPSEFVPDPEVEPASKKRKALEFEASPSEP